MNDVGRKMAKGVRWSALEKGGQQGITFIVFAVLARFVAPEDFGLVAMALVIIGFIQLFIDQGFSTAIIQKEDVDDIFLSTAFWTNIAIGILLALVLVALQNFPAWFFSEPRVAKLIPWMALALLFEALMSVPQALLKRHFNFKGLALRTIFARLIAGAIAIGGAVAGWGVWSLVLFTLLSNSLSTLILWWISDWYPQFCFSSRCFKDLLRFGGNVTGVRFLAYVNLRMPDLIIGYFFGPVFLGYYTLASQLVGRIGAVMVQVLSQVTMAGFSRVQATAETLLNHMFRVTRLTAAIAFPLFTFIGLMAGDIVFLIYGKGWDQSALLISIIAPIGIARLLISLFGDLAMSSGAPHLLFQARVFSTVILMIVLLSVFPLGFKALVFTYTVSFFVLLLPLYFAAVKKLVPLKLKSYLIQFIPVMLATVGFVTGVSVINLLIEPYSLHPFWMITDTIVIGGGVYLILLWILDRNTFNGLRRVFLGVPARV